MNDLDTKLAGNPDVQMTGTLHAMLETLQAGGPVVGLLIAMSVVALAIVLAKLWQFRVMRLSEVDVIGQAATFWQAGRNADAISLLHATRGPVATVVMRAMNGMRQGMPGANVREEVTRHCADALVELRSWLRPLEVIATLSPLLGLFGTVLGMIEAFRQLEAAGNQVNPAILSGGIWVALLTTAVGLAVAIPAVAALNWLERRVERQAEALDSIIARLFTQDLPSFRNAEVRDAETFARPAVLAGGD